MRKYLLQQWYYVRDENGGIVWDYENRCEKIVVVKSERFASKEKAYAKTVKAVGRSRHIQLTLTGPDGKEDWGWMDNCHVGYLLFFPPTASAFSSTPEKILRFQNTTFAALCKTAELLRWDGYSIIPVME